MKNPFKFGREIGPSDMVNRQEEIRLVVNAIREGSKLFLIGPRRYGKTSILRAASENAERENMVVLRYDVEVYPSLDRTTMLRDEQLLSDYDNRPDCKNPLQIRCSVCTIRPSCINGQ